METEGSQEEIRRLKLEVLRLETKLKDLHTSDTVANKRALDTLQQHVEALHAESQGIAETISGLDVAPFNQKVMEEELGALSITALATYVADRVLKASKVLESKELRGVVWTLSATYIAWRVTFGLCTKMGRRIRHNVNCKADLEYGYDKIASRVEVMHQLVEKELPSGTQNRDVSPQSKNVD